MSSARVGSPRGGPVTSHQSALSSSHWSLCWELLHTSADRFSCVQHPSIPVDPSVSFSRQTGSGPINQFALHLNSAVQHISWTLRLLRPLLHSLTCWVEVLCNNLRVSKSEAEMMTLNNFIIHH